MVNNYFGVEHKVHMDLVRSIEDMMKEYPENGTREDKDVFFSTLDMSYQRPELVDAILEGLWFPNLVLTGSFGRYVIERIEALGLKKDYILFNGNIRRGEKPVIEKEYHPSRVFYDEGFVPTWTLLDDSHYSGRTRFVIETYMRNNRSYPITNTVVIYDGCSRWNPHVHSMYNWNMIHGLDLENYEWRRKW